MIGFVSLLVSLFATADPAGPPTIADLPAYRQALETKRTQPAPRVAFRDLWDRPEDFQGRLVAVRGRVERVFHQGAVGTFPPLAEAWIVEPSGNPVCLVFPDALPKTTPKPGAVVAFDGTFLRRIRYEGGDVPREAPLLVGPNPPSVESEASPPLPEPTGSPWDGTFLLVAGAIIGLAILRIHLRRPSPRRVDLDPPPEFETPTPPSSGVP